MRPNVIFLVIIYNRANREIFNSQLPECNLRVSNARTFAGNFRAVTRKVNGRSVTTPSITISSFYDKSEDELIDVLLHEMIHFYIFDRRLKDSSPHGHIFRRMMDDINRRFGRHIVVSTRHTVEEVPKVDPTFLRAAIICTMTDGRRLICTPAPRRFKGIYLYLRDYPKVKQIKRIISRDNRLAVYPLIRTPKLYGIDPAILREIETGALRELD